ncbi:Ig-like domain-containing protein [Vibrio coralliilyticus]|uniref:Ig-like domain-containing protein n=1 Tax=Vibrio coralliilyticus TaxID=190893 RepID=UPI001E500DEC|nr:Ig-like domain-containing protein [Vibrio coralliilyticus]MCC2522430.1 lipase [Vibrio coralliilyticus]
MRKLNILAVTLSAAFILAGCNGEESTTENIAVEVPFALDSIPMPNDGYGYDDKDGSISLPDEPSSPASYSTDAEYEAYYQRFETSFAAVDGWGLCVEPIEIPLDSVNSGQVPAIDQSSLDGNVLLMDGTGQLVETKLSSDGRKIVIECSSALKPSTQYYLAVSTGVKTTGGMSVQPSASFTNLLQSTPSNADEQVLQGTTQEAINAFEEHGHNTSFAYASTFTTQNSYSVIDNVVQQTIADQPSFDLRILNHKIEGTLNKKYVVVSTYLKTNNYLPFTQDIADSEKCELNSYDPISSCPSMYRWMAGDHGEHLTNTFFDDPNARIQTYNDSAIPVLLYLPLINGVTDTALRAEDYIKDPNNPVILFIHGITGDKGSASLVAKDYVTNNKDDKIDKNFIFAAIDMPYHGERIVCDSSNYSDPTTLQFCPDGGKPISARADKSYFINITSPLTLRSNLHQSVSDFIGLRWAFNFGHPDADREVHLIGVSLGGIMSVMTTEATYEVGRQFPVEVIEGLEFATSNYVVPGQGLVNLTLSSLTLGSEMEESVKKSADVQRAIAETLIPNICYEGVSNEECITSLNANSEELKDSISMLEDEIYAALIPILKQGVQQTIDGSDPATKVSRQVQAQQPTLLIEAAGDCGESCEIGEYMPDTVVPNSADNNIMTGTEPLIKALELEDILDSTGQANIRGVIRATVGGHGTFLFPYEGPMDETGLPSMDPEHMPKGNASRMTQQEAVRNMIETNSHIIVIEEDDRDYIEDITDGVKE